MPTELVVRLFDATKLPTLSAFSCGDDQFGKIATDWIKCTDPAKCALQSMADRGTEVFLFYTQADVLVGFGSLGQTTRRNSSRQLETWSYIPQVGIDQNHKGCPPGVDWSERYAAVIMRILMGRSRGHATPMLMLHVHEDNHRARRLYDNLGFLPLGQPNQARLQAMTIENHD